jgi:undecaprenyl-diphosphatase
MEALTNFELNILDWIQTNMQSAFADWFFPLITKLGDAGIFWILVAAVMLIFPKTRKTGAMMGLALIFGLIVCNMTMKPLIARIRPYDINTAVTLIVEKMHDFSFPSGHTTASFEGAVVLLMRDKRLGIPAMILAVLIAFSRLYLYVHFPTDVLAGAVLGTLFAVLAVYFINRICEKWTGRKKT